VGNYDKVAKFPASIFPHCSGYGTSFGTVLPTAPSHAVFDLESAAFMFHMKLKTLGIIRSLQAACSLTPESTGFWLAPSARITDAPNTRVFSKHPIRARHSMPRR
jgi:hypothetical protein